VSLHGRKTCKQCAAEKSLRGFYKASHLSGGYMHVCRECHKQNVYANRELKREHYEAQRRAYLAIPENYQAHLERMRQWRRTDRGRAIMVEHRKIWAAVHPERQAEIVRVNRIKQNQKRKASRDQARAAA
jgi:hypothetical protein